MLQKLDKLLIDRVFQAVVDLSHRQPIWLTRQAGLATIALTVVGGALFGWHWSVVLTLLIFPLLVWSVTSSPAATASFGGDYLFRVSVLVLNLAQFAVIGLAALIKGFGSRDAYVCAVDIAFLAFCYFAACRPPKPRAPKTTGRLADTGAA